MTISSTYVSFVDNVGRIEILITAANKTVTNTYPTQDILISR